MVARLVHGLQVGNDTQATAPGQRVVRVVVHWHTGARNRVVYKQLIDAYRGKYIDWALILTDLNNVHTK